MKTDILDINTGTEYLFVHPETLEAVIMQVEQTFKWKDNKPKSYTQNYILYEGCPWKEISIEDFNRLGLRMIGSYETDPEISYDDAMKIIRKAAVEIGCHPLDVENACHEDLLMHIENVLDDLGE